MNEFRGLWRGKCVDNGKWVKGQFVPSETNEGYKAYIVANAKWDNSDDGLDLLETDIYEVDSSTLGECTGLRDKNGTLIFEGDIIKTGNVRCFDDNDWKGNVGIVEWWNEPASFIITNGTNIIYFLNHVSADDCEVIDNIHDNLKHLIDGKEGNNG